MITPNKLTILTTNTCTAKCAHCTVSSAPDRRGKLNFEKIKKAIDEIHKINKIQVVVFAGGEPTLLKEELLNSISYCDSLGIPTRVVTNGSWAITKHAAEKMISKLRGAGLMELNISADDYHLPFISFENVKRAWDASKGKGFINVAIANCYGPKSKITPEFIKNELGEVDIEIRFDEDGKQNPVVNTNGDGSTYLLSNGKLQRLGRSREEISSDYFEYSDQESLDLPCPWALNFAAISPNNHLVACCGIEASGNEVLDFGSMESGVNKCLEKANSDIIIEALIKLGPYKLAKLSKEINPSLNFEERYASVCEICEDVVGRSDVVSTLRLNESKIKLLINKKL